MLKQRKVLPDQKKVDLIIKFFQEEKEKRRISGEHDIVHKDKLSSYKEYQIREFTVATDNLRNLNASVIDLNEVVDEIFVVEDKVGQLEIFDGVHRKRIVCKFKNGVDQLKQIVLPYKEVLRLGITKADLKAFAYHCNKPPKKPRRPNNKSEHVAFVLDVYTDKDGTLYESDARAFLKTCNNSSSAICVILSDVKDQLDIKKEEIRTGRLWKKYTDDEKKESKISYKTDDNHVMTMSSLKFDFNNIIIDLVENQWSENPFKRIDLLFM